MLIEGQVSTKLWNSVEEWIKEIGVMEYSLSNKVRIFGELDKAYWLNIIVLNTKKAIFFS